MLIRTPRRNELKRSTALCGPRASPGSPGGGKPPSLSPTTVVSATIIESENLWMGLPTGMRIPARK